MDTYANTMETNEHAPKPVMTYWRDKKTGVHTHERPAGDELITLTKINPVKSSGKYIPAGENKNVDCKGRRPNAIKKNREFHMWNDARLKRQAI